MQATAVVETASGKGYHNDGRNFQKDENSSPKKENLLCSNHCNEATLTFLQASLVLEQRANGKESRGADETDGPQPPLTVSLGASSESAHSQWSESEDSIDRSFLNKTYFIHYSESKLENENLPVNSEFDSDMQRGEEVFFDILEHQGDTAIDLEAVCVASNEQRTGCDTGACCSGLAEDSQLEYHSAEEQEPGSSRLSLEQTPVMSSASLGVGRVTGSGCEAECAGKPERRRLAAGCHWGDPSDSLDVCGQGDSPPASKSQSSVMLREHHESKHGKCEEQETSLMYHTGLEEVVLRSSPLGNQKSQPKSNFLSPPKSLKTKIHTDRLKLQVTGSREFCGNVVGDSKMLRGCESPRVSPQDRTLSPPPRPCRGCQAACTSPAEDVVLSASGCSRYENLRNTPDPASDFSGARASIAVRGDQTAAGGNSLRGANGSTQDEAWLQSTDGVHPAVGTEAAGSVVTVVQTVDASVDFRACFTTDGATSRRPPVVSTASNTELTVMCRKPPGEWQRERHRSVACNTDGSLGLDDRDSPTAVTQRPPAVLRSADREKPDGNLSKVKPVTVTTESLFDFMKNKECQLAREGARSRPPSCCCERAAQRAAAAELQLLDARHQLCRRHCADIYALVVGDGEGAQRNLSRHTAKKELGSALLSVLGDLKVRYMSLKEKINRGIPLEELPPLSVESKLLSAFSAFISRLLKEDSSVFSGADSELDNQSTSDADISSSLKKVLSQVSSPSDGAHAAQHAPPEGGGLEGGHGNVDLSQLGLDSKECKTCGDVSEDWFDAQENLTGADLTGTLADPVGQDGGGPGPALEMKTADPLRREKGHLIHVGGLRPSVSEADLRSHFQKYHVSEIAIYGSSTNYRYASLAFRNSSDAKVAVKEMNGMEINGKAVNVRLVKSPGEYAAPLPSRSGNRVGLNNTEKAASKETSSAPPVSRAPRTRPRHLGAGQDSELFPSNQGVKKNCKQIESTKLLPDIPVQFIPPNTLNLRSFTKIMKRLTELHPEASRDRIIDALQEVRVGHTGFLNGLSISTIVEMTSSVLKNSASS
ncbi:PREDICTED: RNA-binding protein 44 [Condylura cristata]|uniref:RNA-binding protein 44 n=1 Tax=Condylura cristata TaxID=143302 RepID=UPI00064335A1|nr:PREDICTED: RNA-binding protein 44 [Condylura cristata]